VVLPLSTAANLPATRQPPRATPGRGRARSSQRPARRPDLDPPSGTCLNLSVVGSQDGEALKLGRVVIPIGYQGGSQSHRHSIYRDDEGEDSQTDRPPMACSAR